MSRFREFLATDGVSEELTVATTVGVMALHGGFEYGTTRLARSIAEQIPVSLYAVVQRSDLAWHLPSTQYDPSVSENLHRFLSHVQTVFSFHGYHRPRQSEAVLLGGTNRSLADTLGAALTEHGIPAVSDLASIPSGLRGQHARNPVNVPRLAGVQIELPRSMRQAVPLPGIVRAVTAVVGGLV